MIINIKCQKTNNMKNQFQTNEHLKQEMNKNKKQPK